MIIVRVMAKDLIGGTFMTLILDATLRLQDTLLICNVTLAAIGVCHFWSDNAKTFRAE